MGVPSVMGDFACPGCCWLRFGLPLHSPMGMGRSEQANRAWSGGGVVRLMRYWI